MDSIFLLDEGDRANFLQHFVQSFGCTYICLWCPRFPQTPNVLLFKDGFYSEENINQPSSSSGSLARRLFDEYRQSVFIIEINHVKVPGFAFTNNRPYIELQELDLQRLASNQAQLQFYQEARIKTAIFMGCQNGEIELGMSSDTQADLERGMRSWFHEDFSRQAPVSEVPLPADQNWPASSSSSSLRSLSMDSPEYSPLLFNIPSTSNYIPEPPKEAPIELPLRPITTTTSPLHEAIQGLSQIRNIPFPIESEDAAMTRAILAVISSPPPPPPPPPPSSSHQPQQSIPSNYQIISQKASAFKSYRSALSPAPSTPMTASVRRQNMMKRAITFFRSLNLTRTQEQLQGSRPTNTQLHHMISERRRRGKLNESFQALRSLLPPGSKKDKVSVLSSTWDYMRALKAELAELTQRNQFLEEQLLPPKEAAEEESGSSNERLSVRVTHVAESTSEAPSTIDLRVIVRGECSLSDLTIRILEFLKQVKNVSLISVEAQTQMVESSTINRVMLRLKIEGGEWDESAFQEAVRRVVSDLAH